MAKKKLVLINPGTPGRAGLTANKNSRFPPLGLGMVAALTPPSWEVSLIDENWETFSFREADLVGITAFTAQATRAYELAALYRRKEIPVVLGGIHASMCTQEALRFCDAVVCGEAEGIWPNVLKDVARGRLRRLYEGRWGGLGGMLQPRRDLFHPGYLFATLQTSRGCPMNCDFCSVTAFNGQRYRRRPVADVLDELAGIPRKFLFFVDDNIIGYSPSDRRMALQLFREMTKRKLNKWWFCQASLNIADDEELLSWAARAGCKMVFLGLEAEDENSLEEMNKQLNLKRGVNCYQRIFRRIHKAGIAVLGAFIYGSDNDTETTLKNRTEYLRKSGIDVMQTTFLTPLPGTRLFQRLKKQDRLLYTDFPANWTSYDMGQVLHTPLKMTPGALADSMHQATRRLYSWPRLIWKTIRCLLMTGNAGAALFTWLSNLSYRRASAFPKAGIKGQRPAALSGRS